MVRNFTVIGNAGLMATFATYAEAKSALDAFTGYAFIGVKYATETVADYCTRAGIADCTVPDEPKPVAKSAPKSSRKITGNNEILQARAGVSLESTVRRILAVWERATAADIESGAVWYGGAGEIVVAMATASGFSREHCATVVAHTSPRTTWARNLSVAWAILMAPAGADRIAAGRAVGGMLGNVTRAVASLESVDPIGTLNGPKTRRFALNILGDRDAVTVDVWAARIALESDWRRGDDSNAETVLGRAGVYAAIEHAYRLAARRAGVDPTTMQATTWVVIRNGRAG